MVNKKYELKDKPNKHPNSNSIRVTKMSGGSQNGERVGKETKEGEHNKGFDPQDDSIDITGDVLGDSGGMPNDVEKDVESSKVEIEADREPFYLFDVHDNPNVFLTLGFSLQQVLMSLSRSLSTALLVADIVCARTDENYKARLLSTTLFISGVCTFLQNTIGIRLPLYQGPAATYVVPLLALAALPEWECPDFTLAVNSGSGNITWNTTVGVDLEQAKHNVILDKTQKLEGSLMIAGIIHMLVGLTGIVGFLIRFIGPITVVPALTITALVVYKATVGFAKTQWGVTLLTTGMAIILSFYLRHRNTPIPLWNRRRGFYIKWSPVHKMFSVLFSCVIAWGVSAILTSAGAFSDDPNSIDYFARTDSRLNVIQQTDWFIFPYPGQFGPPQFETGAFITFMMGTISSIIDSIGDYYACSKVCDVPPPPTHAANRGIAVEGMMSFLAGWSGAGHATSTFGGNIGAIGITRVASLRVFQVVGLIYIVFGVLGKVGAVFITIPYSVIGGMMMINFGILIGVMLSNLQFIDMNSNRNLAIIGFSMLMSLMTPYWLQTTDNAIDTGVKTLDDIFRMLLGNPVFVAGFLACVMDNTCPGTPEERGLVAWKSELQGDSDGSGDASLDEKAKERLKKVNKVIYRVPLAGRLLKQFPFLRYIPVYPR